MEVNTMRGESPGKPAAATFVKGFAGIYGSLDPNSSITMGKIDFHAVHARRICKHQLYLVGTNASASPFSWPFAGLSAAQISMVQDWCIHNLGSP